MAILKLINIESIVFIKLSIKINFHFTHTLLNFHPTLKIYGDFISSIFYFKLFILSLLNKLIPCAFLSI
jgi:hypothetical protein